MENQRVNPGVAAVLSFFFFGLGQIYCGHFVRFLLWFLGAPAVLIGIYIVTFGAMFGQIRRGASEEAVAGTAAGGVGLMALAWVALWVGNMVDAYTLAQTVNSGGGFRRSKFGRPKDRGIGGKRKPSGAMRAIKGRARDEEPEEDEDSEELDALRRQVEKLEEVKALKERKRKLKEDAEEGVKNTLVEDGDDEATESLKRARDEYDRRKARRKRLRGK